MVTVCFYFVIFTVLSTSSDAARVLGVFPVPSISHQVVFRPLTQELAKRGHHVTVITTDPAFPKGEAPANLTEIDIHDISYDIWIDKFLKAGNLGNDPLPMLKLIYDSFVEVFDAQLQSDEIQEILKQDENKYDLILVEACVRPALAIANVFKAPVILVSTLGSYPGDYDIIGASSHPLLFPAVTSTRIYNRTIWEKIREVYNHYKAKEIWTNYEIYDSVILKKHFGPNVPSVRELNNIVDMLFLNTNPVFAGIEVMPPNVIYMGGLHQIPSKPLPTDLKEYLDSSKNGVVYVSFGTNVDPTLLPADRIQMLVRVFSKLPYDVLFKWNNDELPGRSNNIKISKWLPQSDLLKHPKIKLFITQGGQQSTDEAITAGVPLIGIPMIADQWFNVEKYMIHKIGIRLDLPTLEEDQLAKAIHTITRDDSYRRNVIRLRELMSDEPMKPLERAVWWMEYVIRHGGAKHLRSPAANITWAQYLELELVFTVLAMLSVALVLLVIGLRMLFKCIFSYRTVKTLKKKNK